MKPVTTETVYSRIRRWAALLAVMAAAVTASAALNPGDIAIIGYRSDDPDALAFVVLEPIAAGEVIRFTDSGWYAAGGFRANEGGIQYVPSTALTPGTVVSAANPFTSSGWSANSEGVGSSGFMLSTSGDQALVFQGSGASPAFVYAINAEGAGWSDATSSNTTALPTGLINGTTAVNIGSPERDNGYYNGTATGTPAELLAAIGNPSNWVTSDTAQTWPSWSFSVTSTASPSISDVWLSDSDFETNDPAVVAVLLDAVPAVGSPATVSVASGAFAVSPVQIVISNPDDTGTANVTMANNGVWTAQASAVSGCTGSATSDPFSVGVDPVPPVAYAGADRTVVLSGATVTEALVGATANDDDGLTGVTYAWTPATGTGIVGWTARTGAVTVPEDPSNAEVTFNQTGVYTFTLTVTDPEPLADDDSVTLTVVDNLPSDEYDPPATYYDPARPGGVWYTGATLMTALRGIISSGHIIRSYDDARQSLQFLDEDPNDPARMVLAYTGVSIIEVWDGGVTWNREHLWPQSLYGYDDSISGDVFNLRSVDPGVNSARGNKPYGTGPAYWDPNQGALDRGDCARSMFYMDTRFSQLALVFGLPGDLQMGDLGALLDWHYEDPVNEFERRRNHLIYDSGDNPTYYQANRNPFIDRPELVWTIWGGGYNDAQLHLGSPEPDGTSSAMIDLGTLIVDGTLPTAETVTLYKTGADPTTFDIIVGGEATAAPAGPRQTFTGGAHARNVSVGLGSDTATPGLKSGTVVVDNTDLSSSGSGHGSADGNDTISVEALVLAHAEASFDDPADQDALTIDFGTVAPDSGLQTSGFTIYNLETVAGFTADLDLDGIAPAGDTAVLSTDLGVFSALAAGGGLGFVASFDTDVAPGSYQATYTLSVSDEDLSGAQPGTDLVLTLLGEVAAPTDCLGDLNCSGGAPDFSDIGYFVAALNGAASWAQYYRDNNGGSDPPCPWLLGDYNGAGGVEFGDIVPFANSIGQDCIPYTP